jgi:hypothetical protein
MKNLLPVAFLSLCVCLTGAQAIPIPDPEQCEVEPWDTYACGFVTPGQGPCSEGDTADDVTITIRDYDGVPIAGATVQIIMSGCVDLFFCEPDGLTGITGPDGRVILNPSVGGCDFECDIIVRADGVTIRVYPGTNSTDWDGVSADGIVAGADFAFFATAFLITGDMCADYNCDGSVNGVDFALFARSFRCPDQCVAH